MKVTLFQRRKWVKFSNDDFYMTVEALKEFHDELMQYNQPTDTIGELLRIFAGPVKHDVCSIKLSHYELGAVINALTARWDKLNVEKRDTGALDTLTLKLCDVFTKF